MNYLDKILNDFYDGKVNQSKALKLIEKARKDNKLQLDEVREYIDIIIGFPSELDGSSEEDAQHWEEWYRRGKNE